MLYLFLLSSQASSQSYLKNLEKAETGQNRIVYWEYGLVDFTRSFAKEKAAREYGFYFDHVAGCTVNKEILSQISRHNKKVDKLLTRRIGKDWKSRVYSAADSIHKIDTILINHFYTDTALTGRLGKLAGETKQPYEFRVTGTSTPGIYLINAFLLDKDWKVTDKSILAIEASYPVISYRIIGEDQRTVYINNLR